MHKREAIKVAITSINKAKVEATYRVFTNVFCSITLDALAVNFDFIETPSSDQIAIEGCKKRINCIQNIEIYDFIVSLEGMVSKSGYGSFVYGWAVVKNCKNNREAIGCSAKVQIPKEIALAISSHKKLSSVLNQFYSTEDLKNLEVLGLNGIITNGLFTRVDEFDGAIRSAIGYIMNDANYI